MSTRIKNLRRRLGLTGPIVALSVGVILPVVLSTSVGIVTLALGEGSGAITIGVLIVALAAAAIGGAVVVTVLLGRRARLARLQADLLANVTHELRTPLTSIRMYAQTLKLGRVADDPKRTEECLDTILRETDWLEAMVDRVLTWRGAAKDIKGVQFEPAPIAAAVEAAVTRFERMVQRNGLTLELCMESEKSLLYDKQAIVSVILNLLVNAYKYTGHDKHIRVTTRDDHCWVEVGVEDNGIGIPKTLFGKIFDPFYRVDSRLRGQSSGAGLGLAIVRHQIRAHNGEIYVDSKEGEGSRFSFRLPLDPGKRRQGWQTATTSSKKQSS